MSKQSVLGWFESLAITLSVLGLMATVVGLANRWPAYEAVGCAIVVVLTGLAAVPLHRSGDRARREQLEQWRLARRASKEETFRIRSENGGW